MVQRLCYVAFVCVRVLFVVAIALAITLHPARAFAEPHLPSSIESKVIRMMPEDVRSLVERAAASWMNGDAKAFAALFVPDGEFVVPGQRVVGGDAIEQIASEFAKTHTHVIIKIHRMIIDHPQAVVEWYWEDTETSTGKKTQADDAIVIDFAGDRIKRWREYIDDQTPQKN